jgi:hypothetical protein
MYHFSGLSEGEFQQIGQACVDVRIDAYPPCISQLILADLLRKTSPALAKMVLQLNAENLAILLQCLKEARHGRDPEMTSTPGSQDDPLGSEHSICVGWW